MNPRTQERTRTILLVPAAAAVLTLACTASSPAPAGPVEKHPGWRFKTESQWIVATTTESVVALALYASGRPAAGPLVLQVAERPTAKEHPVFSLRFAPAARLGTRHVEIADYVWSPSAYAPIAALLLPARAAVASPAQSSLLQALSDLRPETLVSESRRLSAALDAAPLDPALHAEAAFLLGAFTLREAAGAYSDTRVSLCRMAAHLALARALRGEGLPTSAEALAEVMLLGGVGRQKDAIDRLDAFRPGAPAEEIWARTLRMSVTQDWRALPKPERSTLVERLVYVRAIAERVDVEQALDFVERNGSERVTDWRRILNQGASVRICNTFSGPSSAEELGEALSVWSAYRGSALEPDLVLEALAGEPTPSPVVSEDGKQRIAVLDLGLWRSFERRHLLAQLASDQYCIWMWGWPDPAQQESLGSVEKNFGRLPLFSFVSVRYGRDRQTYARASRSSVDLVTKSPERVPGTLWARLQGQSPYGRPPADTPDYAEYFQPRIPPGTAFDIRARISQGADFKSWPSPELLQKLAEIAPYELAAKWRLTIGYLGRAADHEQASRSFGALVDYDVSALGGVVEAAADHPEAFGPLAERLCRLRVDDCGSYAKWLVEQKQEAQAAAMFRKWFAGARDRVWASNGVDWLVSYDYDHGERAEAFRIAREAAEVSSARGLTTLAGLFEKSGDLTDAHAYFKRAADQYDTPDALLAFYSRHDESDTWAAARQDLLREYFPQGLSQVTLAVFKGEPGDGVVVGELAPALIQYGLRPGSVIVALDGYRVRDHHQYELVYAMGKDKPMALVAWNRSQQYFEIKTPKREEALRGFADFQP